MACVAVDSSGALVLVSPQPAIPDAATCPLVVETFQNSSSGVFQLTPEQGGQIGGAILLVWAVAFAFRLVIKALSIGEAHVESDS